MVVGGGGRVVDGEEVDAPAGRRAEGEHQAEEVGVGLGMRAAEAGGDPADAVVDGTGLEQADAQEGCGQCCGHVQAHPAAGDLALVGEAVRHGEIGVRLDQPALQVAHGRHLGGDPREVGRGRAKRCPATHCLGLRHGRPPASPARNGGLGRAGARHPASRSGRLQEHLLQPAAGLGLVDALDRRHLAGEPLQGGAVHLALAVGLLGVLGLVQLAHHLGDRDRVAGVDLGLVLLCAGGSTSRCGAAGCGS